MSDAQRPISFEVVDARPEPHAAVPTLALRLRITAPSLGAVHAIALRCQLMVEPQRRRYAAAEEAQLTDLFGDIPRWGDTLRPFVWTTVSLTIPGFQATTDIDLPIICTYDMEVAATRYFHALGDGEIPLLLLFSGTVFTPGATGFSATPIAWHEEASYRLPVSVWRAMIDAYFPNSGWLRLDHETLDALRRFRGERALMTWEETMRVLLKHAGEDV